MNSMRNRGRQASHNTNDSRHTTAAGGGLPKSPKSKKSSVDPSHRRTQTMDPTLAELSQALARSHTLGSVMDLVAEVSSGAPASAGAALVRNAGVLFGERQKTTGNAMAGVATPQQQQVPPLPSAARMGRSKTSGSTSRIDAVGSGDVSAASSQSSSRGRNNWNRLRNVIKTTDPPHPRPPSTADDDPSSSSASQKSATGIPGSVQVHHQKTDSGKVSESCDRIEETGEDEGDGDDDDVEAGGLYHVANAEGGNGGGGDSSTIKDSSETKDNLRSDFRKFMNQRRPAVYKYIRFFVILELPALALSFILFYAVGE